VEAARNARLAFAYFGQARILVYCPACPAGVRAPDHEALRPVDGFWAALRHVDATFARRRRKGKRQTIRALVKLKGGPARITEASAILFLNA
jgi:hypothetical protein